MTIINTVAGSSAKLAQKEVVPTSFPVSVEPPEGYDGLSKAIVDAPANLSAENIKAGVDIAGVVGGYDNRLPEQEKSVKAVEFPTDVVPDEGKVLSKATVIAPDNLAPENIRKDVAIAGVTGTYDPKPNLETVTLTPTVLPTTVVADAGYDGMKQVNVEKPETLVPENVKDGVNIAGVVGTFAGGELDSRALKWLQIFARSYPEIIEDSNRPVFSLAEDDFLYLKNMTGRPGYSVYYFCSQIQISYLKLPTGCGNTQNAFQGATIPYTSEGYVDATWDISGINEYATTNYMMYRATIMHHPIIGAVKTTGNYFLESARIEGSDDLVVPEGITVIGYYAYTDLFFSNRRSDGLDIERDGNLVLPSTVKTINTIPTLSQYGHSKNHTLIMKRAQPPTLGSASPSYKTYLFTNIQVPKGSLEAYRTATNWTELADIMVEASE
jgi:hypothetical protein